MKGRKRTRTAGGWVTYAAIQASPNGTRVERRAWERLNRKQATPDARQNRDASGRRDQPEP